MSNFDIQPNITLIQELGVEIFRIIISWRQLEEYGKNNISLSYLNKLDDLIFSLEQENIRILICLYETPCWASSSSRCSQGKYRQKYYNDYSDALVYLYQHYHNRIYAWEIWNEPNLSQNWLRPECQINDGLCYRNSNINDQDKLFIDLIDAQEYSNMVNITYKKMKLIHSNIILLAGSLLDSDQDYLNEMYKYGIKNLMDGLSIHAYISSYAIC